jgi:RNA polymerase sigma-70 factor (ECF subfamily)
MTMPVLRVWLASPSSDESEGWRRDGRTDQLRVLLADASLNDANTRAEHDRALAERVKDGDSAALDALYRIHFADLWQFAAHLLRQTDGATDIVQDVFVAVWSQRMTLDIDSTVRGYLFASVRNRIARVKRDVATARRKAPLVTAQAEGTWASAKPVDPAEHTEARELERAVMTVIEALPERQRMAVELRWTHGMTYAEVARVMGISQPAARKLLEKVAHRLVALRRAHEG